MCFIWHPGRPCCSGLGHSSQPLGKQVRLFCSPKVRAHLILLSNRRGETLLERQLKAKDQRIKLMSEILAGIKVDLWVGQYNCSFLFQLRFWSSTLGRCLSWAPLTLSGVKRSRCWSFFYFHIVITCYHSSRCWSGSPSSGLSPTLLSLPFPSSWLSQPSSPTYTGRNWLSPKSTQWRPYFFAQRSRAQQVDRWLDLHVSLPFQPRPNATHTFPFCSDGHHQALCQVCCHIPITN